MLVNGSVNDTMLLTLCAQNLNQWQTFFRKGLYQHKVQVSGPIHVNKRDKRPAHKMEPTSSGVSQEAEISEKLTSGATDNPTPWKETILFSPICFNTWGKKVGAKEKKSITRDQVKDDDIPGVEEAWYCGTIMLMDIYALEHENFLQAFENYPLQQHQRVPDFLISVSWDLKWKQCLIYIQ